MKKYLVMPAHVRSVHDGDVHFIDAHRLMALYCVHPSECVVANSLEHRELRRKCQDGLLKPLTPRYDGKYPIFEKQAGEGQRTVRDE